MGKARLALLGCLVAAAAAFGQGRATEVVLPGGAVVSSYLPLPNLPFFQQTQATAAPENPPGLPALAPALVSPPAAIPVLGARPGVAGPTFWGSAEYLSWQLKGQALPPMITTGNPFDLDPGALGQPGTHVVYGGGRDDYDRASGARLTLGMYLDPLNTRGVELSGFYLDRARNSFSAGSNAVGQPPLYLASFRPDLGREGVVTVSSPNAVPGVIIGRADAVTDSRLYGAQLALVRTLADTGPSWIQAVFGAQYLNLSESFRLRSAINDQFFDVRTSTEDSFTTRNQFIGGVVGARVGGQVAGFFTEVTGKVSVGANRRQAAVNGTTIATGSGCTLCGIPVGGGAFPGGVYAQPTNMGHDGDWGIGVIPQLQARVGYEIATGVRVFAGYEVLWWNDTVRPEDRVDRVTNLSQRFGGPLLGAPRPAALGGTSSFWASGFSIGLDIRY